MFAKLNTRGNVGTLAFASMLCLGTSAFAQQAPGTSDAIEEITVTAQRTEENLQDVPIAVTALTAQALEASGIDTTRQLQQATPGLVTYQIGGSFIPFLRGVGSVLSQAGADTSVAIYVDGVYQASKASNIFDLTNLDRVEVLRGPQGTLFGRNATGGAINVITRDPEPNGRFDIDATYGSYNDRGLRLYAANSLTDTLTASVAYANRQDDGYIRNVGLNSDSAARSIESLMVKLRWEPASNFVSTLSLMHTDTNDNSISSFHVREGTRSRAQGLGNAVTYGDFETRVSATPTLAADTFGVTWNNTITLPGVDLVSISAYRNLQSFAYSDSDFSTSDFGGYAFSGIMGRQLSQEIQFVSTGDGPFRWIGGLYYFWEHAGYNDDRKGLLVVTNAPFPLLPSHLAPFGAGSATNFDTQITTTAWALYGQASYDLTEADRLTVGVRYSDEEKAADGRRATITSNASGTQFVRTVAASMDLATSWQEPTWRISYDHDFSDDVMVYVSYNRGFKSGAYNTSNVNPAAVPVNPEILDAYEVGFKSQWFNDHLRFNAAAFHYEYADLQVQVIAGITGLTDTQNAGNAQIRGMDFDLLARPTRNLTLRAGLSLLDTEYTEFKAASLQLPRTTAFTACPAVNPTTGEGITFAAALARAQGTPDTLGGNYNCAVNVAGQDVVFAPAYSGTFAISYEIPLASDSRIVLDGSVYFTDSYNATPGGIFTNIDPWESVNAAVTWYSPGDRFYVKLWGDNVLDNVHAIIQQPVALGFGETNARPATVGVTVGYSWGS